MQIRDAVVPQAYTAKDGSEKTSWYKVGVLFIGDDGKMSMSSPLVNGGRIIFVEPKNDRAAKQPNTQTNKNSRFTEDELRPDEDVAF